MSKRPTPQPFPRCDVCTEKELSTGDRDQFNRARTVVNGVLLCERHSS